MTTKEGGISRPPFVLLRLPRRGEGFCVPVKKVFHPREARAASGGPLFPTAGKVGKRAGRNQWFLHFLARYAFSDFDTVCLTVAQNVSYRFAIESSLLQRRCRSYRRRITLQCLPLCCISGSGAKRKSIRRGVKKTCRWHVFSLRSRRLCRRSIHLDLHRNT